MIKTQERVFGATALILAITLFFAALCYGATCFDPNTAPKGRYTVDRIEGDETQFAICEHYDTLETFDVPISDFPFGVSEGDRLYLSDEGWTKDTETAFDLSAGTYQITISVRYFEGSDLHAMLYDDGEPQKFILSENSTPQKTTIINISVTGSGRFCLFYDGTLESVKIKIERI